MTYPDLPILSKKDQIIQALKNNSVVIVAGETGSGKSTQLPKICLEAGFGQTLKIAHTQPRRVAARTIAQRIAQELECCLGEEVGFKIRFSDRSKPNTQIKVMTDGILLSETHADPLLRQYDCIIIDEAHERSLNIDFLMGYIKTLLSKRKDLKVIITSATIDIERFSKFFNNAPIIEVSGRTYPVEVHYLCDQGKLILSKTVDEDSETNEEEEDPIAQVVEAVKIACQQGPGDILIFQTGEKEIWEVIFSLKEAKFNAIFLPLYARQSANEQRKIFESCASRKIIVATNVAETSLTVPNIRYVIDSGKVRISRYNYRTKLQRLPIEPISQASSEQRKGRCGRVGPGICYRLYSEEDLLTRSLFTEPEILRTNLAGVILKMLAIGIKEVETFPFVDPPDYRHIKDGLMLLERLGAIDKHKQITSIGRLLAEFPIEPKLGRAIIAANDHGALEELLIISSALSIIDPRERPIDFKEKVDLAHARFYDKNSDFIFYLNLWRFIQEKRSDLSEKKFRKLCRENFFSFRRICEWVDVYDQLKTKVIELGFKRNQVEADYSAIHQSLLIALLDSIGVNQEKKTYLGARNLKFMLHPSSTIFKKPPLWIMAYEIVHTTQPFSRNNAAIESRWIIDAGKSLLKRNYFEPHFDPHRGQVIAYERITLFGLELVKSRKIVYEKIDPKQAREIFIQQGLVEGLLNTKASFYQKNKVVLQQLEELGSRLRKQHVLIHDEWIMRFYNERLPAQIYSDRTLTDWLKHHNDDILVFTLEDINDPAFIQKIEKNFPISLEIKGQAFKLEYIFDLESEIDGVTIMLPIDALPTLKDEDFSWPIAGLLEDKILAYIRALPKRIRILFFPLLDYVRKAKESLLPTQGPFELALANFLQAQSTILIEPSIWQGILLPAYLKMHFKVIARDGVEIRGDSLIDIYESQKQQHPTLFTGSTAEKSDLTQWDFDEIPILREVKKEQYQAIYYSALVDHKTHVNIELFETNEEAEYYHARGLARMSLFYLQDLCQYFKKNIPHATKKVILKSYAQVNVEEDLWDALLWRTAYQLWITSNSNVRSRSEFEVKILKHRHQFIEIANHLFQLISKILKKREEVLLTLEKYKRKGSPLLLQDIEQQLDRLFPKNFIQDIPFFALKRYLVYLKAIEIRLDKINQQDLKDRVAQAEVEFLNKEYMKKLKTKKLKVLDPESFIVSFRWKIEELRVSLFAQSLGTTEPVSKIRLLKLLEKLE